MPLTPGARLGPYEVVAHIGVGGMGEVYRAHDTKLNRDVALKVLPETFATDPDRLARFVREAKVLASLNHPHIAAIYGFEDSSDTHALVLELVPGSTLADRVAQGPLPLDEALPVARQIAKALEAAHEQGIIHRDLKPANIKLRDDGTVKVLDFGLAKALEPEPNVRPDLSNSPTIRTPAMMTGVGTIIGTVAYMSPEQARGKAIDRRTDIWAFGCVLFEMLTGTRPFGGEDSTAMLARIIEREPEWQALPAATPAAVRALIARCLKKDPGDRLRDIADGRFQIEEVESKPSDSVVVASTVGNNRRQWTGWVAAVLFLGVTLFQAARPSVNSTSMSPGDLTSFQVFPPEKTVFSVAVNTTVNVPSFALAPDGHALVFSAVVPGGRSMLWVRSLDQVSARQLAGTEDAQDPLWSPDSRWIGFFAEGKLKKVPAAGGAVQVISPVATDVRGGAWGADDTLLFGSGTDPIVRVSSSGGTTTPVTVLDAARQEGTHRYPHILPDGHHFLYSILGAKQDQNGVYAGSLDGKIKRLLVQVNTSAVYAAPGYVLFVDGDTLLGQEFDAERLDLKGHPFVVAEHVGRTTAFMSAVSASHTQRIAYAGTISQRGRLTWMDRKGTLLGSVSTPEGDYTDFRLSPDETRLAASLVDPKTNTIDIWLTDLMRGSTSRVASGSLLAASALWSSDGAQLVFRANKNGIIEFYQRSAAGGGNERPVLSFDTYRGVQLSQNLIPTDWSPDGQNIVFSAPGPGSGNDLWLQPLGKQGKTAKFIASAAEDLHGNFSPDGRLMAYTSNESGKYEVYVETVPRSDRKWPVSTSGGYEPRWRSDGREIYYLSDDRRLMAVSVGAGPSFAIPQPLFQTRVPEGVTANRTHYVPSRDGQRFLVNMASDAVASPITVVLNWTAGLKK